ncbi:protease modulator HflC [Stakelama tenebrarum]|uniref:Protein HflC n=1 Tax=Stakelama tenebrarum TaxID=2711215 RepID=A0A6G6Y962_9SPHN|nr:protease modulator HflC [Sphingosinithalassobacter tenebrarum]QIG81450.1 protease modulator HflC [Sphingosinithalassobacter tenebrarum]
MSLVRNPMTIGIAILLVLVLLLSSVAIVPETRQAVILRFEKPIRTVNAYQTGEVFGNTGAGPIFRVPFLDRIVWVDKRVQGITQDNLPVLSTDQLRLEVDAFARYRIVDPLRMVITARSEEGVATQLRPLLGSALRNELGKREFAALLSPERGEVMESIQRALQVQASQYGVEVVDVRIKHADLPDGSPLDSAFDRMRTARRQEAATIAARGRREAQIIRADADAQAAKIYAESFGKDPDFYDFYRAMQSYRYTFAGENGKNRGDDGRPTIVLSPDNQYLREFQGRR